MNAAKLYATAAAVMFLVAGPAGADNVNLVANGTFEASAAGWRAENATLTLAGPGAVGTGAAQVSLTGSATSYYLYPTPRPVGSTVAGATYTAGAFVRGSFLGRRLCLRLREWSPSGAAVGAFSTCLKSNRGWQRFNPISWKARSDGKELEVYAYGVDARQGDSLLVVEITLQTAVSVSPARVVPESEG